MRRLGLAGDRLPAGYARALSRYRHGPGVFKLDWALDGPIPWTAPEVARAGTVHVGGTLEEVAACEEAVTHGRHLDRPFVLLVQASLFDPTRAPEGKHTAWAYCHVPNGSSRDMTAPIEAQVERFAPGFRDLIAARKAMGPAEVQRRNPNYIGGDINGGVQDLRQSSLALWRARSRTRPRSRVSTCARHRRPRAAGCTECAATMPTERPSDGSTGSRGRSRDGVAVG